MRLPATAPACLVWVCAVLLVLPALSRAADPLSSTANLIVRTKGAEMAEKELSARSKEGWLLAAAVEAQDKPGTYLWYFTPSPAGKTELKYEILRRERDLKDAGPLNLERGNKGWHLVAVLKVEGKDSAYLYFFAELKAKCAHGIVTGTLGSPEALDEKWGSQGFRLVGLVPSQVDAGKYKYYIALPEDKKAAQEHKILATKSPQTSTDALDRLAKEGWRLCTILPTALSWRRTQRGLPVATSQSRAVPSSPAVRTVRPSGL
jgi:hypothetical protein